MTYLGGGNFVGNVIWARKRGKDNSAKFLSRNHEYLLLFAKDINLLRFNRLEMPDQTRFAYKNPDNDLRGDYRTLGLWARGSQGGSRYSFTTKTGLFLSAREWLVGEETMFELDQQDKLIINGDKVYRKMFLTEYKGDIPETIWDDASNAANAADEIKSLFNYQVFDTAKPIPYISKLLKIATLKDSILLDFFSGSATTAHAVMKLNAEDGGNRKYILVQLPAPIDPKKDTVAYEFIKNELKAEPTIAEIGKERIRRAGEKIKAEMTENDSQQLSLLEDKAVKANLDIGFKVFKLDETNFTQWDEETTDPAAALLRSVQSIKPNRTSEDALYEILLKYGIDLTLPVTELEIDSRKVFSLAANYLLVCLEKNLSLSTIEEIAKLKPERVVFYDDAFKDDVVKLNAEQTLRKFGVEDVRVI